MTHEIRKTDDGGFTVTDSDGRPAILTDPETGRKSTAEGFDSSSDARKAAKDSGLEVQGESRAQGSRSSSGGSTKSSRSKSARKS